ncbi:MAG: hypothetical protein B7W97_02440 [Mycobacterium sp. 20-66-4]|nr:MAG: hypothetical protein B7W97_02440 [Mycobacterium sp. 20-66-4]
MRVQFESRNASLRTQAGLQNIALKFAGPDLQYFSKDYVPQNLQMAYGGQSAAFHPVFPQVFYPAASLLTVGIQNLGATALTEVVLYFRGVKLFYPGSVQAYTYPSQFSILDYRYPISPDAPYGVQNLLTTDSRRLQPFTVKPDADFVLRALQAGPSYSPFALEVFITLRDQDQKPYSNRPVHFEVLCGPSGGTYQSGVSGTIGAVGTGNSAPGILYPEIYVPKSHQLFYDITRNDAGFGGAATIPNFPITLIGAKVFTR